MVKYTAKYNTQQEKEELLVLIFLFNSILKKNKTIKLFPENYNLKIILLQNLFSRAIIHQMGKYELIQL